MLHAVGYAVQTKVCQFVSSVENKGMRDGTPLIEVKNLEKTYGAVKALDDFSLDLQQGEILGLLGPNGAGKTTAMHIMLGILTPTAGEVSVLGLSPFKNRHALAKRINFSSAYVQLPSNLKVWETMGVFAGLYSVKKPRQVIEELLELFEMQDFRYRLVGALSSGEKTRLNLCKSFLNDPEILFMDEPTASLDPDMADKVRKLLKKRQQERHMGVIYTSHNMAEVESLCHRIQFMHQGRTQALGTKEELLRHFALNNLDEVFIRIVREGSEHV